jgi:hypothetical protein
MKAPISSIIAIGLLSGCASNSTKSTYPVKATNVIASSNINYLSIGNWKLGDSRDEIRAMPSLPNLKPVKITGGLETADAVFEGKKRNISFVFDDNALAYTQTWVYEGRSLDLAIEEFSTLYNYLSSKLQGAKIKGIEVSGGMTLGALKVATKQLFDNIQKSVDSTNSNSDKEMTFLMTLDLIPNTQPNENKLHGKFVYSGRHGTFYIFLFEDLPNSRDRSSPTHVQLMPNES